MRQKVVGWGGILSVFFSLFITLLIPSGTATAQVIEGTDTSGAIQVIDSTTVRYKGVTYRDDNPYDGQREWRSLESCRQIIRISDSDNGPVASYQPKASTATRSCADTGPELKNVGVVNPERRNIDMWRLDDNNIFAPTGFKKKACGFRTSIIETGSTTLFRRAPAEDPNYKDNRYFDVLPSGSSTALEPDVYLDVSSNGESKVHVSSGNCGDIGGDDQSGIVIGDGTQLSQEDRDLYALGGAGTIPDDAPDAENAPEEDNSCESRGAMGWIICPGIKLLDESLNWLDKQIQNLLLIDESQYQSDTNLHQAWSSARNIAYLILVPMMLFMVIGTAIEIGPFDAYTVKKALPRMVAAVIFITFSWNICTILIQFFNVLGTGILGLATAPFSDTGPLTLDNLFSPSNVQGIVQAGGLAIGTVGLLIAVATIPGLMGIIGSYAIVASLAVFIAFLVLTLRQMFIIALILLSPLAILSWIFPGNDKLWKWWWGFFTKLLIMFPLIMLIIAAGRIFATVVDSSTSNPIFTVILKLLAYVLPYLFIPFTFKFAGGVFANLAGIVNDRGKGLFDRQRKRREAKMGELKHRTKGGELFNRGWAKNAMPGIMAAANRRATGLTTGASGHYGLGRQGQEAIDQSIRRAAAEVAKDPNFQAINQDDNVLRAKTYHSEAEARAGLMRDFKVDASEAERAIRAAKSSGGFGGAMAVAAAQQLVNTGTGYDNIGQMAQTLARAADGNASTRTSLVGFANYAAKQSGRFDLAPGFGNLRNLADNAARTGEEGHFVPNQAMADAATLAGSRAGDSMTILRGKTPQMVNLADTLQRSLTDSLNNAATTTGAEQEVHIQNAMRIRGQIDQLNFTKSYASSENQQVINDLVGRTSSDSSGKVTGASDLMSRLDSLIDSSPNRDAWRAAQQRYSATDARGINPRDFEGGAPKSGEPET